MLQTLQFPLKAGLELTYNLSFYLQLVAWCKGIFGTQFYEKIIKATIYKQFVAGETEKDVKYIASELQKSNINCMFCIPTEDVSSDNL